MNHDLLDRLNPKSIAIVGASTDISKFSGRVLPYLLKHGYRGDVYPINPKQAEISGRACHASLSAVPGLVDCVVYCLGAAHLEGTLREMEARGDARLLLILSTGFAEAGTQEGRRLQDQVTAFSQRTGTRTIGPNCVGFLNSVDGVAVAAAAVLELPALRSGHVGVVSQSGGHAFGTIIWGGHERGIGFSRVVTTGNEADTGIADWANALVDDDATDSIALTLEGVRNGPAFHAFLANARDAGKPIVILKSGQSALGQAMAASHTGAIAGSLPVFRALCKQYGVTLVDDLDELYEVAAMFAKLRRSSKLLPTEGPIRAIRCAALSISGGHIGLFADLCARHKLEFAQLEPATQEKLAAELGRPLPVQNPVDLSGGSVSDPGLWGRCTRILLDDRNVDIAVPILTIAKNYDSVSRDLLAIGESHVKTLVVAWVGGSITGEGKPLLRQSALPLFEGQSLAAKALAALDAYRQWRSQAHAKSPAAPTANPARTWLERLASAAPVAGEWESKQVLGLIGFPTPREAMAASAAETLAAAASIGYPVALKGIHPLAFHKSDSGLVRLNVRNDAEATQVFQELSQALAAHPPADAQRVLVQEMAAPGVEVILGARQDPVFGPVVLFGLGGIFVETMADFSLRLAPLTQAEARAMIDETGAIGILKGARGRRPADLDAVAALIVKLGDLVAANGDLIEEIDVNPLVIDASTDTMKVVDALIVFKKSPTKEQLNDLKSHGYASPDGHIREARPSPGRDVLVQ